MNISDFLSLVLPQGNNFFAQHGVQRNTGISSAVHLTHVSAFTTSPDRNEWYSMASYTAPSHTIMRNGVAMTKQRCIQNVDKLKCLWIDADIKPGLKPSHTTKQEVLASISGLSAIGLPPNIIVDSGNSYHAYWLLKDEVGVAEWSALARGLTAKIMEYDEKLGCDRSQWNNPAALLRLPNSFNHKTTPPNPVVATLVHKNPVDTALLITAAASQHDADMGTTPSKAAALAGATFKVSYATLLTECNVMRQMATTPDLVDEPSWYAALGVLKCTYEGEAAAIAFSRGHPGFDVDSVKQKYAQAAIAFEGITTCARLVDNGLAGLCAGCSRENGGKSPASGIPFASRNPSNLTADDALSEATARVDAKAKRIASLASTAFNDLPVYTGYTEPSAPAAMAQPAPVVLPELSGTDPKAAYNRMRIVMEGAKYIITFNSTTLMLNVAVPSGDKGSTDILMGSVFEAAEVYIGESGANGLTTLPDMVTFRQFKERNAVMKPVDLEDLIDSRSVGGAMKKIGVTVMANSHAAAFMNLYIKNVQRLGVAIMRPRFETLGWSVKREGDVGLPTFMCANGMALTNGVPRPAMFVGSAAIENTVPDYDVTSPASVTDALKRWTQANQGWMDMETGLISFAASFASPFVSRFGIHSCTIHESGLAGCFKTTSMKAAATVWMNASDAVTNMEGINGVTGRAEQLAHLPIFVDEITAVESNALLKFVLMYSEGKSKDRRASSGSYGLVKSERWHNLCVTTGNTSVTYAVSKGGVSSEGAKRRYLEFTCKAHAKADAEVFKATVLRDCAIANEKFWGVAGAAFIANVQNDWEGFQRLQNENVGLVKAATVGIANTMDAQQRLVALMLTSAMWCSTLSILKFDIPRLTTMLLGSLREQASANGCDDEAGELKWDELARHLIEVGESSGNAVAEVNFLGKPEGVNTSKGLCPEQVHVSRYCPSRNITAPVIIKVYDRPLACDSGALIAEPPKLLEVLVLRTSMTAIATSMGLNKLTLEHELAPKIVDEDGNFMVDTTVKPLAWINASHFSIGTDSIGGKPALLPVDNRNAYTMGMAYVRMIIKPAKV